MIPVEILAVLMLVSFFVLLMAGVPVALTLATSGFVFGLSRLRPAAVQPAAAPHLRRGHELDAARDPAVRVHGHDAGALPARRGPDGRDRTGRRLAARRARHRHHPGRRADGRDHRHRRRHRGDARPADAARHAAARLRQGTGVRDDLRVRHARPDHPAEPDPDPARRHHEPVGRHAVRRGDDPWAHAGGHLLRLHPGARRRAPEHGAGDPQGRACAGLGNGACREDVARGGAAGRAGRRGAGIDHRRRRGAVGSGVDGRARLDRDHCGHRPAVLERAARNRAGDHQDHRDDDVHPDLRAGVRAGVPRPAGRTAGSGFLRASCRAASGPTSGS